jgi:hypothetical protein
MSYEVRRGELAGEIFGKGEFVFPIEPFEGGNGKGFDQNPAL